MHITCRMHSNNEVESTWGPAEVCARKSQQPGDRSKWDRFSATRTCRSTEHSTLTLSLSPTVCLPCPQASCQTEIDPSTLTLYDPLALLLISVSLEIATAAVATHLRLAVPETWQRSPLRRDEHRN